MPCGEFKHRYWFFADTPNNATIPSDIWSVDKDLWRWADSERLLKYRGVYDVKSVSQPDTMPILENNYCLQIIETGFEEHF